MIFVGNQRGGGRDLGLHLMKPENERVEIHQIRGFVADDLVSAFKESYAISKATKCKQHLYSLSINPPKGKTATVEDFEDAIERAEDRLGLTGQPRAIVFHEKFGSDGQLRRHAHAVWCRIKTDEMKAVQMSYDRERLMDVSRDLFIEHDWQMPRGMVKRGERDPLNFTLEEWQQTKRAGKDARKVKGIFKDCWAVSDSKASFAHALEEHGYVLARGDRRGFVAVDHDGEKYAVARYVDIKTRQVRERLGSLDDLPDVEHARVKAAGLITGRLQEIQSEQALDEQIKQGQLLAEREREKEKQRQEAQRLAQEQAARQSAEEQARQARLRKGLPGLWDRFTGKRKQTVAQNETEAELAQTRDAQQKRSVRIRQQHERAASKQRAVSVKTHYEAVQHELSSDIQRLSTPPDEARTSPVQEQLRRNRQARTRNRRGRSRDGPSFER